MVVTLHQSSKEMMRILTKSTPYTDYMALQLLLLSLLCHAAGFLQFKLLLFAVAALQALFSGSLHDTWSRYFPYSKSYHGKTDKEFMEIIVLLLNIDL